MARITVADIIRQELEAAGVDYEVYSSGKHLKFRWGVDDQVFQYSCAKSASDWRAGKNSRAEVRRLLRQSTALH